MTSPTPTRNSQPTLLETLQGDRPDTDAETYLWAHPTEWNQDGTLRRLGPGIVYPLDQPGSCLSIKSFGRGHVVYPARTDNATVEGVHSAARRETRDFYGRNYVYRLRGAGGPNEEILFTRSPVVIHRGANGIDVLEQGSEAEPLEHDPGAAPSSLGTAQAAPPSNQNHSQTGRSLHSPEQSDAGTAAGSNISRIRTEESAGQGW